MRSHQPEFYEIKVAPADLDDIRVHESLFRSNYGHLKVPFDSLILTRRSIDARKGKVVYVLRYQKVSDVPADNGFHDLTPLADPEHCPQVVVVGAGPAGYFAAFRLIQSGIRPVVVERGKDVQSRRRDLRAIMQESIVNEDSNYCFGEGGAGTYSDGKLYTRSTKRGDVRQILNNFVFMELTQEY